MLRLAALVSVVSLAAATAIVPLPANGAVTSSSSGDS
jgi:hypothetical protein